jgi:hypothetical protein
LLALATSIPLSLAHFSCAALATLLSNAHNTSRLFLRHLPALLAHASRCALYCLMYP